MTQEGETSMVTTGRVTTRGGGVPIQYPMLNDTNYGLWAVKMRIILRSLGVWAAIEGEALVDEEKDQGALAAISQAVPDPVMMAIAEKETAKEAWEAIREMRVGEDRVKKARIQVLKRHFDRMIMEDSESIYGFSQKLTSMVGELRNLGAEVKDCTVVEKLFNAVPDKFLQIVGIIEQWGDVSTMSVTEAIGRLQAFEETMKGRRRDSGERDADQLMLTRVQWEALAEKEKKSGENSTKTYEKNGVSRGRRGRGHGNGGGRGEINNRRTYRKFDKSRIKCYNCEEYGHFESECTKSKEEAAHLLEECDNEEPALLMIEMNELITNSEKGMVLLNEEHVKPKFKVGEKCIGDSWYLDSGASNHMTGCESVFKSLDKSVKGSVKFGDGSMVDIQGCGTILVQGFTGEHKVLTNVYYIPRLRSNIISIGRLDDSGCKSVFENGTLSIFDKERKLLIRVQKSANRLYVLQLNNVQPVCLMSRYQEKEWL